MELFAQRYLTGGVSEDDRLAGASQYLYGENIDGFSEPDIIQLSTGTTVSASVASAPYNMVEVRDRQTNQSKVIVLCDDNIYHADSGTAVYTNATMNKLQYPAFVMDGYFYWVTSGGSTSAFELHRTTTNDAMSSSWSPTVTYKTLSNNNYFQYFSHIVVGNEAYIALGNIIEYIKYDGTTEVFDNLITDEIVGMAGTYSGIMIFTETGKMHLWDGVTNLLSSTVNLNIRPSKVYQFGTQIYLLGGGQMSEQGLYYFDGATAKPIYKQKFSSQVSNWKFRFESSIQSMTNDGDNLYLIDRDTNSDERVAWMGSEISGAPKGLHYINTLNAAGSKMGIMRSILYSDGELYIGWTDDGSHGVDTVSGDCYTTGHFYTNVKDYNTGIIIKNNKGVYFRVRDIDANHTIQVQASVDGGTYTTLSTINAMPKNGVVRITDKQFKDAGIGIEFEDISFKFTLTTNDSTSPKIFKGFMHEVEFNRLP